MQLTPLHAFATQRRFDPIPFDQLDRHLPGSVVAALPRDGIIVFACADEHSDTAAFSVRYDVGVEDCANTLVVKYSRHQTEHYAAIVTLGSRRLDLNGAVRGKLDARKVSLARREVATDLCGMEFGGITAFGLPGNMPVLVDAAVMERPCVVMGAGCRRAKLLLEPAVLLQLPTATVAPLTLST